jgi:Fe-S cluster biosynthesis and repair protein YggX
MLVGDGAFNLPFPKDLKRKYFNPESEKEWKEWQKTANINLL